MKNQKHILLHERALEAASNFRHAQADLIEILQEVDNERSYLSFDCKDLGEYAQTYLKLSDDVAWTMIKIARMSVKVPMLKIEIERGEITTTNARMILPVLEKVFQKEPKEAHEQAIQSLLHDAQTLSKRALEKKVAAQNPELAVRETIRYVAPERLKVTLGVSEELLEKIKRVQDLESQRTRRAVSLEEALAVMAEQFLERHDPVEKARRAENRKQKTAKQDQPDQPVSVPVRQNRPVIRAEIKHAVTLTDSGQCSHIHPLTKQRCTQKRWLDFHHKLPISQGGVDTPENLTLLCSGHHKAAHSAMELGFSKA